MNNYSFIAVEYNIETTKPISCKVICTVEDLKKCTDISNTPIMSLATRPGGYVARTYYYGNDTSIAFRDAFSIAGTGTANNTFAIPLKVIGIK